MLSQRQIFLNHLAQTSDQPLLLEITRAEGVYLYDQSGKKYIDLISGIGVANIGHSHPKVVEAAIRQVRKHMHVMVYGEYIQEPQNQLAELLLKTLPSNLDNIYFLNSGSEAVEAALKLAKRFTYRNQIMGCTNAYHGSSHGALSVTGSESLKQAYRPLIPGVNHLEFGNMQALNRINSNLAAVIIETIQGEAGVRVADKQYFKILRKKCTESGTLLIMDEIQCGIGRTGKFWAFEHYDIVPDVIVSAKALGGGMPLGALIASKKVMNVFSNNPVLGHITTFGGHPVSTAAARASLEVLLESDLLSKINRKAELFKSRLNHPAIKAIRNSGLLMAVEFDSFDVLKPIITRSIEMGVITDWFLFCDNAMRIAPPLTITDEEIEKSCDIINQAIEQCL